MLAPVAVSSLLPSGNWTPAIFIRKGDKTISGAVKFWLSIKIDPLATGGPEAKV
jgi:hypothetical protein